jgi:hypothetical protein
MDLIAQRGLPVQKAMMESPVAAPSSDEGKKKAKK